MPIFHPQALHECFAFEHSARKLLKDLCEFPAVLTAAQNTVSVLTDEEMRDLTNMLQPYDAMYKITLPPLPTCPDPQKKLTDKEEDAWLKQILTNFRTPQVEEFINLSKLASDNQLRMSILFSKMETRLDKLQNSVLTVFNRKEIASLRMKLAAAKSGTILPIQHPPRYLLQLTTLSAVCHKHLEKLNEQRAESDGSRVNKMITMIASAKTKVGAWVGAFNEHVRVFEVAELRQRGIFTELHGISDQLEGASKAKVAAIIKLLLATEVPAGGTLISRAYALNFREQFATEALKGIPKKQRKQILDVFARFEKSVPMTLPSLTKDSSSTSSSTSSFSSLASSSSQSSAPLSSDSFPSSSSSDKNGDTLPANSQSDRKFGIGYYIKLLFNRIFNRKPLPGISLPTDVRTLASGGLTPSLSSSKSRLQLTVSAEQTSSSLKSLPPKQEPLSLKSPPPSKKNILGGFNYTSGTLPISKPLIPQEAQSPLPLKTPRGLKGGDPGISTPTNVLNLVRGKLIQQRWKPRPPPHPRPITPHPFFKKENSRPYTLPSGAYTYASGLTPDLLSKVILQKATSEQNTDNSNPPSTKPS